jgi:hypothetical protein
MTAFADLISREALARLFEWPCELDRLNELDSMMRKPGSLACPGEPPALHHIAAARDEAQQ